MVGEVDPRVFDLTGEDVIAERKRVAQFGDVAIRKLAIGGDVEGYKIGRDRIGGAPAIWSLLAPRRSTPTGEPLVSATNAVSTVMAASKRALSAGSSSAREPRVGELRFVERREDPRAAPPAPPPDPPTPRPPESEILDLDSPPVRPPRAERRAKAATPILKTPVGAPLTRQARTAIESSKFRSIASSAAVASPVIRAVPRSAPTRGKDVPAPSRYSRDVEDALAVAHRIPSRTAARRSV